MRDMLTVENLRKSFGDLVAVEDVSFSVAERETCGLLDHDPSCPRDAPGLGIGLFRRPRLPGRGLVDVVPQVTVLTAYAGVLLALSAWRLRRAITAT